MQVMVKVHAQLACIAHALPPAWPDSDTRASMAGCIEASFSQGERGFFFSPLLAENQGDCAAPRLSPDASKRERLHITHACWLQLRCACRAVAGGPNPAAGNALFRQLAQSCNQPDGCDSPSRSWAKKACDTSDMASARFDFA